ncbi:MAG TPA: bifunctional diguanylate cyclase/phosphodiesterase [Rectinemataceae bacterium]|nr:bifunctional diguanylate cyclase/phosphodiesterase [Rectinemataceae bacterium]
MSATLPEHWSKVLSKLEFAFQPITLFATSATYGFEALLRGWDHAGFTSIAQVFDRAFEDGVLCAFDLELRAMAFGRFMAAGLGSAKIFYNVDNRLLEMPDNTTGNTMRIAEEAGLSPSRVVFELSELHDPDGRTGFDRVIAAYRRQGFRIALDDFGSGYAGLKLFHRAEPDIVKIDRYFVSGIAADPRKAAFLEKVVAMAHLMGITVVAEGVENELELRSCRDAGCDMVQGYFIARPTTDLSLLALSYPEAAAASTGNRRTSMVAGKVGEDCLIRVESVDVSADLSEVLTRFRKDPNATIIPAVNDELEPVGIYREQDFRQYVYSPYGIALLEHIASDFGTAAFLVRAPTAPLGTDLARIVELYGSSTDAGGVVLTEAGRYVGVLPAAELLSLVAERDLAEARDQNPLTRLPGNMRVDEICAQRLANPGKGVAFAYFDFDNFKPFNDRYGFRNGDRVIMLFADILRSVIRRPPGFLGHLGGDDFFVSMDCESEDDLAPLAEASLRFSHEAASFYSAEDRERGWILGTDRGGRKRRMPLLTVSVAIVLLQPGASLDAEGLSEVLAELKKAAKTSETHRAVRVIALPPAQMGLVPKTVEGEPVSGLAATASAEGPSGSLPPTPVFTPSLIAAS